MEFKSSLKNVLFAHAAARFFAKVFQLEQSTRSILKRLESGCTSVENASGFSHLR